MSNVKSFDALPEFDHAPSVAFELGGREWHCKAATDLPLNFLGLTQPDGTLYAQIGPFFERVLVPDEVDDFLAMLDSPRSPITFANASPLMAWVTEQLTKRPTRRPSSSQDGPRATARKSGGASSSRVTPKRR